MPNTLPIPAVSDDLLRRRAALEAVSADGDLYSWPHFDVVLSPHVAWVAQDDTPMIFPGEEDPIPREWRGVLALLWEFGYGEVQEPPLYDTVTEVWLWLVER